MKDADKTRDDLLQELSALRERIDHLEKREAMHKDRGKVSRDVPEGETDDRRLRRELWYRALVESVEDWIWEVDSNGVYAYTSPTVKDILGYEPQEVIGKTPFEFMPPKEAERVGEIFREIVKERRPIVSLENINIRKDGSLIVLETSGKPFFDDHGNLLGYRGVDRDVTGRKRLQDLIASAKKDWEETFDIMNDAITIHDREFTILRANRAAESLLGMSFREIIGQKCHELYHGLSSPPEGCASCRALTTGVPTAIEIFEPRLNRYLEIKAFPQLNEKREVIRLVHVIRDITEQKRTEGALRDSERFLREAQRVARLGSYVLDVRRGTWRSSQVLDEILGIDKEYPRTVDGWISLVHPEFRQEIVRHFTEEGMKERQRFDKQYKIIRQTNHEERWVHDLGELEFDEKGSLIRMVGTVQDITEGKKVEEDLIKAQKLESVGVLAGGIAHDFNNLLQAIMGNLSLAKTMADPADRISLLLEEAEKASERAKELSYRLLTFSKGGDPVKRMISIESLLREAAGLSLSGSNVACEFSLPGDLAPLEVDEGQISQVFHNLLINAKEAMPEGGSVRISAANIMISGNDKIPLKEGEYVKISVADHGIGIPEENLLKIFDPYFSTKERGSQKGMGLGLAICHSIIARHEGHIAVESEVGSGTVFHVYLPASPKKIAGRKTREEGGLAAGRGRVLFMDDDERVRRITGAMLQQLGYDVEYARNGEEAVERYRRERESGKRIDAVILDLTVQGGMGGEKAIRKLLEIDPAIKAVISSGYADDPLMKEFREYGFLAAIAKPYTIDKLKEMLTAIRDHPF